MANLKLIRISEFVNYKDYYKDDFQNYFGSNHGYDKMDKRLQKEIKIQKYLGEIQGNLSHLGENISSLNIPAILREVKSYKERTTDSNLLFFYSASKIDQKRKVIINAYTVIFSLTPIVV